MAIDDEIVAVATYLARGSNLVVRKGWLSESDRVAAVIGLGYRKATDLIALAEVLNQVLTAETGGHRWCHIVKSKGYEHTDVACTQLLQHNTMHQSAFPRGQVGAITVGHTYKPQLFVLLQRSP